MRTGGPLSHNAGLTNSIVDYIYHQTISLLKHGIGSLKRKFLNDLPRLKLNWCTFERDTVF